MAVSINTITATTRNYLEIFFRRKALFFTPTILCLSIAIAFSYTIPPKYRTSTIVLVEEEKVANPLIRGLAVSTTVRQRLRTIVKILLSTPLLEQVVSALNLDKTIESPVAKAGLLNSLRNDISVQLVGGDLLKVTVENYDPEVCQKIANTVTTLFIEHNLELQKKEMSAGIDFLQSQRDIYEKELKESERALREFKQKYQTLLPERISREMIEALGGDAKRGEMPEINVELLKYTEFKGDLVKLNLELKEALNKKEQILKQLKEEDEYIVAERIRDPIINKLEEELTAKQVELATIRLDATERHPLVRRIQQEMKDLQREITRRKKEKFSGSEKEVLNPLYQELKMELKNTERRIEGIKTRIKLTEAYLKKKAEEIKMIPERQEQLAQLRRDYSINAGIYADLTKKLETAYITRRLELQEKGTKFRIVEPAKVPAVPFKPNRKFMAFAGTSLGMIIGIGLIFFSEMTDHSFTEINQLRNFLSIPVLASISQILTMEEAAEAKAKKRFYILCFMFFLLFIILGAIAKYIVSQG